jgi:hypothetical protein
MGNGLFGGLSGKIASLLGPMYLPATLIKTAPGKRSTDALAGTNPTSKRHACRAIVGSYDQSQIDGTLVTVSDRRIQLLGDTIEGRVAPEPSDCVIVEGAEYLIVAVARDADRAVYNCQSRVRG